MKRKNAFIIISVLIIVCISISCFIGCSSNGLNEEDFEISITNIQVKGSRVTVEVEFKNNSWHNGWIVSSGDSRRPSTLINVIYKDENGEPMWGVASIAVKHWIKGKQKITKTVEFQLEKGQYTITAIVDFYCNINNNRFYYFDEKVIEV
ncbi:MAG: hypothetical protein K2I46_00820 [Clostridia bacterium]|nr:hypothetical protein [Clostridia bacterium]